jgi:hypothetical protein
MHLPERVLVIGTSWAIDARMRTDAQHCVVHGVRVDCRSRPVAAPHRRAPLTLDRVHSQPQRPPRSRRSHQSGLELCGAYPMAGDVDHAVDALVIGSAGYRADSRRP